MKVHQLTEHGGEKIIKGKGNWPDMVRITINRYSAWNLIKTLTNGLFYKDKEMFDFTIIGKLDVDIKED